MVQPGQELFRLIRKERLEWRAEVASGRPGAHRARAAGAASPPAGGAAVQGKVRMVAPTVDAATRNGIVYVDLPQPRRGQGRHVRARRVRRSASSAALTLPQSAVLLRDGFSYVFEVGADNKVQQVKVGVGRRIGDRIEVDRRARRRGARRRAAARGFLADGDLVRVVALDPTAQRLSAIDDA